MKYCEEYAALLDLFVDGELSGPEMERVRDHLAACPGCRAYVDDALAIRAGFPDAEDTVVPEDFARGVMERIRKAPSESGNGAKRRRALRRWTGTAAALAACCALVILVRTGSAGEDGAPAPAGEAAVYSSASADNTAEGAETGGALDAAAPEETPEKAPAEIQPTARMAKTCGEDQAAPAAGQDSADLEKDAALYLTEEEAGDLLDGFTAVWENAVEWRYELNEEEFRALLEALNRPEELPEGAQGPYLVVVTGPEE